MILKHFLMGFGGVAIVTGVGIGVYYGTNSSENVRKEIQALEIKVPEGEEKDKNKDNQNKSGSSDTRVSNDTDNSPLGEGSSLNTRGQNKK